MQKHVSLRLCLLTSTAIALAVPASAQDAEEPGLFTMLGRIVFGAGAPKVAIEVPQSVTALGADDLERAQPTTLGDVVEQAPGVSLVGTESRFGESLNIRGIGTGTSSDESRIVTVIDGVKKYYESYRQGSLFTDPAFFKDVELLRGPSSSTLYGSGAVGGVVSLSTKDAADFLEDGDTFAVKQKLEFKSNGNGRESSTFLAFAPDDRFEGLIGLIYDKSGFMEDGSGNRIFGTAITETNVMVKGGYSFGEDGAQRIEAGFIRYNGSADDQLLDVIDNGIAFGTVDREVVDETAFVTYNYNAAGNPLIDLDVQLSYGSSENYISDATTAPPAFDSDYIYEGFGLKIINRSEWIGEANENYLTFGAEFYEQDRITLRATPDNATFQPEGNTKTFGVFAQNEMVFNETFTVIGGLRLDYQKTKPGALVPTTDETSGTGGSATLALHYQATEQVALFGSGSFTERLPVIDELYDSRVTTGADQPAAGTLGNERSLNFELGMSYTTDDVLSQGDQLSLKGTVFHHTVSDLIARNDTGVAGDPTYANIDKAKFVGLEIEGAYESDLNFGSLALTVMDGEDVSNPASSNPNLENRIPADTLRLTLGRRIPSRDLELGWTGTYYDSKSRVAAGFGGALIPVDTPSNLIHDVYASWKPEQGIAEGTEIRLGIKNLLDEDYRTHLQSTAVRRAGRSLDFTISKTF